MHAFKFQAVTLPNRLIANMKEHSHLSFHLSLLKLAALTIFKITSCTTFPHIKKIFFKDPSDRCWKFSSSFIYFAINQKYNNSIQKYIKDNNIQFLFRLSYLQD